MICGLSCLRSNLYVGLVSSVNFKEMFYNVIGKKQESCFPLIKTIAIIVISISLLLLVVLLLLVLKLQSDLVL